MVTMSMAMMMTIVMTMSMTMTMAMAIAPVGTRGSVGRTARGFSSASARRLVPLRADRPSLRRGGVRGCVEGVSI